MDKLHAIRAFIQVVDSGSFYHAAQVLQLSPASASRRVADLEAHLGVRLLQRSTRSLSLTDAGQQLFNDYHGILQQLAHAEKQAIGQHQSALSGRVRLTASTTYGVKHLSPKLVAFQQLHPQVQLDIQLHEKMLDLIEEGFDFGIRLAHSLDERLVAKHLEDIPMWICASPTYLQQAGEPVTPQGLVQHNCLLYQERKRHDEWVFMSQGKTIQQKVTGKLCCNHGELILAHALAGLGIAYQPDFIVGSAIKQQWLQPILTNYLLPTLPVYAVYSDRRILSPQARALLCFLQNPMPGGISVSAR